MDLFDLFAKISIDTSEYEKGVDSTKSKNEGLTSSFSKVAQTSETMQNKIAVLASQHEKAQKKVEELTEAFNKSAKEKGVDSEETQKLAKELSKAETEAKSTQKQIDGLTESTEKSGDEFEKASEKTSSFADKLKTGLATAAKVGAAAITAASGAVAILTKTSIENYGEYEQLVGGVETLFKNSADVVQQYAANAYKTAGMSANDYMETVTSFSASLLQSLDNDTAAAAEKADQAITDMADNANKMGTSMESIQNAYQGFAKQNYTMLDNLKLGYGGTQEEMKRLIQDAANLTDVQAELGVTVDANSLSYANIVDAIHVVQANMGIMGTTAAESSDTIQGSVSSMQSAWTNLVTGIADDNADLDVLIGNFVDSVETAGDNIIPRIEQILSGISNTIIKLSPMIQEKIPELIEAILPGLISAVNTLITTLAVAIPDMLPVLAEAAMQVVDQIGSGLSEKIPELSAIFENLETVVIAVTSAMIAYKTASAISGVVEALTKATKNQSIAQAALNAVMKANPFVLVATLIAGVVTALITLYRTNETFRNKVNAAWTSVKSVISNVVSSIVTFFTKTVPNAIQTTVTFFTSLPDKALNWGKDLIDNFVSGIKSKISAVKDAVSGIASKVESFIGFSEPEEGPLSNFHTYAPDMMKLFAEGIRDNADIVQNQLDKSLDFDFGTASLGFDAATPSYSIATASAGQTAYSTMESKIADAVNKNFEKMFSMMGEYFPQFANAQVVLDTGTVAGQMAPAMNVALNRIRTRETRGG